MSPDFGFLKTNQQSQIQVNWLYVYDAYCQKKNLLYGHLVIITENISNFIISKILHLTGYSGYFVMLNLYNQGHTISKEIQSQGCLAFKNYILLSAYFFNKCSHILSHFRSIWFTKSFILNKYWVYSFQSSDHHWATNNCYSSGCSAEHIHRKLSSHQISD